MTTSKISAVKIGDLVRSFDFPNRFDCYVEGIVLDIVERGDCAHYQIMCDRDVFGGKDSLTRVGEQFFPPVNGVPTWLGGVTCGVELVAN